MRSIIAVTVLLGAAGSFAEEMQVHRDLPYVKPRPEQQSLDVCTGLRFLH